MLDDQFPSYYQIMKVQNNPTFKLRQHWERKLRAKFSRTIRRHMRDPQEYTASTVWTAEESDLADDLLALLDRNTADLTSHPAQYLQEHPETCSEAVRAVWENCSGSPIVLRSLKSKAVWIVCTSTAPSTPLRHSRRTSPTSVSTAGTCAWRT